MATIKLVEGNTAPAYVAFTLSDAAGAKDLTGATVEARLTNQNTGAVSTLTCSVVSEATGQGWILCPDAGWPGGLFDVELDVTYVDGTTQTFPNDEDEIDEFLVREVSA